VRTVRSSGTRQRTPTPAAISSTRSSDGEAVESGVLQIYPKSIIAQVFLEKIVELNAFHHLVSSS
jgi:hypothetical protein